MSKVEFYALKEKSVFKAIRFNDDMPETLMNIQKFIGSNALKISYNDPEKPIIILSNDQISVNIGDYIYRDQNRGRISMMDGKTFNELYELRV